jgi:hypothetical protein
MHIVEEGRLANNMTMLTAGPPFAVAEKRLELVELDAEVVEVAELAEPEFAAAEPEVWIPSPLLSVVWVGLLVTAAAPVLAGKQLRSFTTSMSLDCYIRRIPGTSRDSMEEIV